MRALPPALVGAALGWLPTSVGAFVTDGALANTSRWDARIGAERGLHDGIQVAVSPSFADDLGATDVERPLLEEAVRAAFAAWETEEIFFEIDLAGPVQEDPELGAEIDVFAVPETHPVFAGITAHGTILLEQAAEPARQLTNGQSLPGWVIKGADIFINVDQVLLFRDLFGLDLEESRRAFQRLLMHEIGHALGLEHPNENLGKNVDTDDDPFNPMVLDGCSPFEGLLFSRRVDPGAIMSNVGGSLEALMFTELRPDDRGGRDVLYPSAPPGVTCPPLPPFDLPGRVLMDAGGDGEHGAPQPRTIGVTGEGTLYAEELVSEGVFRIGADGSIAHLGAFPTQIQHDLGPDDRLYVSTRAELLTTVGNQPLVPLATLPGWIRDLAAVEGAVFAAVADPPLLVRVTPDGRTETWFEGGTDGVALGKPTDALVASDGALYVISQGLDLRRDAFRIDPAGRATHVLGPEGAGGGHRFGGQASYRFAVGLRGQLFVMDLSNDFVLEVESTGAVRLLVDAQGDGVTKLDRPLRVVESGDGRRFVHSVFDRVFRIDPEGDVAHLPTPGLSLFDLSLGPFGLPYVASHRGPYVIREDDAIELFVDTGTGSVALPSLPFGTLHFDDLDRAYGSSTGASLVFRVDPLCRPALDAPPEVLALSSLHVSPGNELLIETRGASPEAHLRIGPVRAPFTSLGGGSLRTTVPPLTDGAYSLSLVNPPLCPSRATTLFVPEPGGHLGTAVAMCAIAWLRRAATRVRARAGRGAAP